MQSAGRLDRGGEGYPIIRHRGDAQYGTCMQRLPSYSRTIYRTEVCKMPSPQHEDPQTPYEDIPV